MKKATVMIAMFWFGMVLSQEAFAIVDRDFDRPVLGSEMTVVEKEGVYQDVARVELVVTRQDGERNLSALLLTIDGETQKIPVVAQRHDACGSTVISGEEGFFHILPINDSLKRDTFISHVEVEFQDHSTRRCEDLPSAKWQTVVIAYDRQGEVVGRLVLDGHPEPVYSIQLSL